MRYPSFVLRASHGVVVSAVGVLALAAGQVNAAWTFMSLAPGAATDSTANSIGPNQQGGFANVGGLDHACIWNGTPESWIDLHPASALFSLVTDTNGTQQVGVTYFPPSFVPRASVWAGSAASRINLNPSGSSAAGANATTGTHQYGFSIIPSLSPGRRAGSWEGSAASWVDMHPAGVPAGTSSDINHAVGNLQVGYIQLPSGGLESACKWNGTAASWVNLADSIPLNTVDNRAFATDGVQIVGSFDTFEADMGGPTRVGPQAVIWDAVGSGFSMPIISHPVHGAARNTEMFGVLDGRQVGHGAFGGTPTHPSFFYAVLWEADGSWVNLGDVAFGYNFTVANDIWRDGTTTYVAGSGTNTSTGNEEALLWIETEDPCADLGGDGVVDSADLAVLLAAWGQSGPADLDGSGSVDSADLAILLAGVGQLPLTTDHGAKDLKPFARAMCR